jgi:hypothetical protein
MGTFDYKDSNASGSVKIRTAQMGNGGSALVQPTTPFGSYITVSEYGIASDHLTKLTISGLPVTLGNTTGISFGSKQLLTFPKGKIHIVSSNVEDFLWGLTNAGNATPIAGTMGGDFSLGSSATADATLNNTEVNILASTSYDPFSTAVSANSAINVILDGTTTPISVYLNAIIDDADVADAASDILELSCTMWFKWYWMAG